MSILHFHAWMAALFLMGSHPIFKADTSLAGYYLLRGIPETGAGFSFFPGQKFEFYFSYGSVDRHAEGTYDFKDGKLVLNGTKQPGKDFTISKSLVKGEGTTIMVNHNEEIMREGIICIFKRNGESEVQYTDKSGTAVFNGKADSVMLLHPLYPDEKTVIKAADAQSVHNHFELAVQPIIEEISFKQATLTIEEGQISGKIPSLFGKQVVTFHKTGKVN